MMDLSREAETMVSELSMGVAIAVTMSVCARMVPFKTSPSAIVELGLSLSLGVAEMRRKMA